MKDPRSITRRRLLAEGAAVLSLTAAGALVRSHFDRAQAELQPLPFPFVCTEADGNPVLDAETVRRYAFNHYFQGGCMHGAASGLMQAFKEAFAGKNAGWDFLPYASCVECHGALKDQVGKMDCLGCHSPSDVVSVSGRHPDSKSSSTPVLTRRRIAD